ncbi:MarR family winged helix-turn-helix transcriptional regulator [Paenibacillus sp. 2TAB19]|uniref:MarR family winged helix-turn-helix transcriptional regulator n=1 Tax=Paenibacillus sp. 2TAB19 TaxID=3233003 RepID=UPI003F9B9677
MPDEQQTHNAPEQSSDHDDSFLHTCLYFTTNRLNRAITRMADEAFATTGLTPAYGYLIRLVIGQPGITQKELSEKLYITPSTLTRFIDKLEGKRLVERKVQGKTVLVYPTEQGKQLGPSLREASKRLKETYEALLGKEAAVLLTGYQEESSQKLES